MRLTVNGSERRVPDAWRDETLLSTLRQYLGLIGAKYGCGIGSCGTCKVQIDGVPVHRRSGTGLRLGQHLIRSLQNKTL